VACRLALRQVNLPSVITTCCATLGVFVALLVRRISGAPGSGDLRCFTVVCVTAVGYTVGALATTLPASPTVVLWCSRGQVALLTLQLWAWIRLSTRLEDGRPTRLEGAGAAIVAALAPLPLVPGAVYSDVVTDRLFAPFHVVYRAPVTTPTGDAFLAVLVVAAILVEVRFLRAWRRGARHADAFALAFAVLLLLGSNDALTSVGFDFPFMLDWGNAAPILAVAWVLTSRFIDSARALDELRGDLAGQVEARTRELSAALESLHQAEKLAAIGQFASGVAHEVNSPAAAVTSSLRFLAEPAGATAEEAREAARDALAAMERINALVRELVDAGRVAELRGTPSLSAWTEVGPAVVRTLRVHGPKLPAAVVAEVDVPGELAVRFRRDTLEQVLGVLVENAAEAFPAGRAGRLRITAAPRGGAVVVAVADDGGGMAPEVLRRAFEPFFTTKAAGRGTGLSLAVARGLVESAGGSLTLESVASRGTTASLVLPAAARAPELALAAGVP
jgi:signal transduction histidine kinase